MRIALGVEYDGSGFCGWQIQDGVRTVQACVEQAMAKVANHPVKVITAGRTDSGVHASGQVIHFDTTAVRSIHSWVFGANANLPKQISITWGQQVSADFHARFSATGRHYRYVILNRAVRPALLHGHVSWDYRPLDVERMAIGAQHLLGIHDFSSYRAVSCQAHSPVREVRRLEIARHAELIILDIAANAFLQHMVRNIAGVLMAIGAGERSPDWALEVLQARDRTLGGVTASPHGLTLLGVDYPDCFGLPRLLPIPVLC